MFLSYSKTTGGFYDREIHGDAIPSDAVEISGDVHAALMAGQAAGKIIAADQNGRPMLVDAPAPSVDVMAEALTRKFKEDTQALQAAWVSAAITGGSKEAAKKSAIAQQMADIRAEYAESMSALGA